MPDILTLSAFTPHEGSTFAVETDADSLIDMELIEVSDKTPKGFAGEQFSLIFEGPSEPILQQRIYGMRHTSLGRLELFLVPVGRKNTARLYEAFFNRSTYDD